jgi:hypothetical protein
MRKIGGIFQIAEERHAVPRSDGLSEGRKREEWRESRRAAGLEDAAPA